jgi:hypothetical protein
VHNGSGIPALEDTMADAPNFARLVPGFDFLQGLAKNAGAALPNIGQWVAPTLDPEALEKRIGELRTVQFWLEQNARMLGATIQALEVQRMTLSTLKTMNVQMEDLRDSLQIRMPGAATPAPPTPTPTADGSAAAGAAPKPQPPARRAASKAAARPDAGASAAGAPAVDPLQWWGALTKQFTELAADAMKETTTDAAKNLAGKVVQQSFEAAGQTLKKAMPGAGSSTAARPAAKRRSRRAG